MKQSALGGAGRLHNMVQAATLKPVLVELVKSSHQDFLACCFGRAECGSFAHKNTIQTSRYVVNRKIGDFLGWEPLVFEQLTASSRSLIDDWGLRAESFGCACPSFGSFFF